MARQLAAHGHEVFTPTMTGLGERLHLNNRKVDLTAPELLAKKLNELV